MAHKLPRHFFTRPTLTVAPELLGKYLVANSPQGKVAGEIVEVEAYLGAEDPASHAYRGQSARTEAMWLQGGHWYVYFIYGIHFCLNIVTEVAGLPGAILIRAIRPMEGIELMKQRRGLASQQDIPSNLTNGPGKVAQAFGITKIHNGIDSTASKKLWLEDRGIHIPRVHTSRRIGISKATEVEWRFTY